MSISSNIGERFDTEFDTLAQAVMDSIPLDANEREAIFMRKIPWRAPPACEPIINEITAYIRDNGPELFDDDEDEPEDREAWLKADEHKRAKWIANAINAVLYDRGVRTGDWTWHEWLRLDGHSA